MTDLLEPLIPGLRRYAWGLVRNAAAADDLVQSTLERAVSRWTFRRADGDLKAWLFAIQRNLFLDTKRGEARRGRFAEPDGLDDVSDGRGDPERALIARDALARLDALPEEQRSILLLVGVEDLSYEDVALVLDVPVGTVMSRLSRARDAMRRMIETGGAPTLRRVK